MEFEGKFLINAPRNKVWEFVSNTDEIVKCVPGLKEYEKTGERSFTAKVKAGVGFIKGTFNINVAILEEKPDDYFAKLALKGKGVNSSFNSEVEIKLEEESPNTTTFAWKATAETSGLLGGLAKGMIQGAMDKVIKKMFECVKESLEAT